MRVMSTIKSIIIFVLSIVLVLETGFAVLEAGIIWILHEEKKHSNGRRRYPESYHNYFDRRKSS